jgi:hypothetical protein
MITENPFIAMIKSTRYTSISSGVSDAMEKMVGNVKKFLWSREGGDRRVYAKDIDGFYWDTQDLKILTPEDLAKKSNIQYFNIEDLET